MTLDEEIIADGFDTFEYTFENLKFKLIPKKCNMNKYDVKYVLYEYGEITKKWYRCMLISPYFFFSKDNFSFKELESSIVYRLVGSTKKILIFNDKYSDSIYDASNTENIGLACLKVLKERYEDSYYGVYNSLSYIESQKPNQDASLITDPTLKKEYDKLQNTYLNNIRIYHEQKEFVENVKKAIDNVDLNLAYSLLNQRIHYEYEGFNLINVETVGQEFLNNL